MLTEKGLALFLLKLLIELMEQIRRTRPLGGKNNMTNKKYHRAFGVYGIYVEDGKHLVINKNAGPYIKRFDLLGGSLEEGETLSEAMKREFLEETGLEIEIQENIGVMNF